MTEKLEKIAKIVGLVATITSGLVMAIWAVVAAFYSVKGISDGIVEGFKLAVERFKFRVGIRKETEE